VRYVWWVYQKWNYIKTVAGLKWDGFLERFEKKGD